MGKHKVFKASKSFAAARTHNQVGSAAQAQKPAKTATTRPLIALAKPVGPGEVSQELF
jgi:hypothetical protein